MVDMTLMFLGGVIEIVLNTDMILIVGLALVLTILGYIFKIM